MSPIFDRFRSAVRDLRKRKYKASSSQEHCVWKRLPTSAFVNIVAQCTLDDVYSLSLTCHVLHRRIKQNEYSISQQYLRRRKRGRDITAHEEANTSSPGDDLTFISDLFPPPPPQYTDEVTQDDRPEYSFGYLADLTRCWTTCIRLSYHLAAYAVQHHLRTDSVAKVLWSSSKTEKDYVYTKGVSLLQSRILRPVAYLIFFLESYASNPRIPSAKPFQTHHSANIQESILQHTPFNDTEALLSTHHCMHLLCSSVRRMMTPDIPYASTENWVSLLLTMSTLERMVQFFIAAAEDGNEESSASASATFTWNRRREFLLQMRKDLDEYMALTSDGFSGSLRLRGIWFEAAEKELNRRESLPHISEEPVPILHGSGVMLRCRYCEDER